MIKKIGTSLVGCMRDILSGAVKHDQIFVIMAPTCVRTHTELVNACLDYIKAGQFRPYSKEQVVECVTKLWYGGKVHQPRLYLRGNESVADSGVGRGSIVYRYRWLDLVNTKADRDNNPSLAEAWSNIDVLETLITGTTPATVD